MIGGHDMQTASIVLSRDVNRKICFVLLVRILQLHVMWFTSV
jgi:hypothetical protein